MFLNLPKDPVMLLSVINTKLRGSIQSSGTVIRPWTHSATTWARTGRRSQSGSG